MSEGTAPPPPVEPPQSAAAGQAGEHLIAAAHASQERQRGQPLAPVSRRDQRRQTQTAELVARAERNAAMTAASREENPAAESSTSAQPASADATTTSDHRATSADLTTLATPDAAEGVELLTELRSAIARYVVLPNQEALTAVTLWVAASHIQPVLQHAPRMAIVGPTKKCGKSRLLDILAETVNRPMITVNTSPAVIFRVIGMKPPTLLVDEADTIFGAKVAEKNEELRGLLNAGHQRNRPAWRITGPEHKPTAFPTFAMAALAGIGDLPDTIMDRAIVIRMQRRRKGEEITDFRVPRDSRPLNDLRDRLTAWLTPLTEQAAETAPPMPVADRAADTWEPLVLVADLAGGEWPTLARTACVAMTAHEAGQDEEASLKTRLLRDIRRAFAEAGDPTAMRSRDLLAALCQDAEAPWADHSSNGFNAHHLSSLLRDFGIRPVNIRFPDGTQAKGYPRSKFTDPWDRYCPEPTLPTEVTQPHQAGPSPTTSRSPTRSPSSTASWSPSRSPSPSVVPVPPPGGTPGPARRR
ncbi:DUF3631 domain-containing protein [Streptomyces sp. B22F1]|uniref:DUF3631 domain-containing protein n=1 Tax=Streptomyces sp. B22F1 TaxID=3153566 RepID=UPI00325DAAC5